MLNLTIILAPPAIRNPRPAMAARCGTAGAGSFILPENGCRVGCESVPETQSLLAIDVALLPPEWVRARARQINRALAPGGLVLDHWHVPHITLAQCFVLREAVPLLVEHLTPALRATAPLSLRVVAVVEQSSVVSFLLEQTAELRSLHERLMDALKEWEEEDGGEDAFYSNGESARDKDVAWVANFRAQASYGNFTPHITLGIGVAPQQVAPFAFLASEVGLYHLGRYCTCRALLHQWAL